MAVTAQRITPCLWFDGQAEDAANTYVGIFRNSRIVRLSRYGKEGHEIHGREAGSVMTVEFEIEGQRFVGLNGGPHFKFNEAVSFQVHCETQEEIDHYWINLSKHGEEGPCGWLKDRYGVSWQIVPKVLPEMLMDPDPEKSARVTKAFLQMKKFDIEELERAYRGQMVGDGAPLPVGFVERRLAPRRHAVFTHHGEPSGLRPLVQAIFHDWLPRSGHAAGGNPDFVEVYGEGFDPRLLRGAIEIWVPLQN